MKRIVIAISLAVLAFAVAVWAQKPAQSKAGNVEQELIKLENGWNNAWLNRDPAFVDKILSDDWLSTDFEGEVKTKAQELATLKSGVDVTTSILADDWDVRVYGDTAVVRMRNTQKETINGKDVSGQYRWTDTWIKKAGRWQCVASHASKVVQK